MSNSARVAPPDVLLLDVDGVMITGQTFKTVLAEKYDIHAWATDTFFRTTFVLCQLGQAELVRELRGPLRQWGWPKGVEDFIAEWFQVESELDHELLKVVERARLKGVRVYLATMQERSRMDYLLSQLDLQKHVDGSFATYEVGYPKTDPRYFETVLRCIDVRASRVLFVDDTSHNTDVAKICGLRTLLYRELADLEKELGT